MKNYAYLLLVGAVLSINVPAFAETRAVTIGIGSIGGTLDDAAVRTVRQVIGHAVARGTVDTFLVYGPSFGSPIPIEGGLSACAEARFNTTKIRFNAFIRELRSIHPKPGTFYNIERSGSCNSDGNVACTEDAKLCPDGSAVGRVPPCLRVRSLSGRVSVSPDEVLHRQQDASLLSSPCPVPRVSLRIRFPRRTFRSSSEN